MPQVSVKLLNSMELHNIKLMSLSGESGPVHLYLHVRQRTLYYKNHRLFENHVKLLSDYSVVTCHIGCLYMCLVVEVGVRAILFRAVPGELL